jgi:hypothetical protein
MPNFKGNENIQLQPGDLGVPYRFAFSVCTSETANDGAIPYGDSVSSCAVTGHTETGTDVTSELIASSSTSDNAVTVSLNYPSTTGEGNYHLKFVVTTANGVKIEFDFNRIKAKDL